MNIIQQIKSDIQKSILFLYQKNIEIDHILINETNEEYTGDYTLVTFALSKTIGKNPAEIAQSIGENLISTTTIYTHFEVIKGFLNLTVNSNYYTQFLVTNYQKTKFGNSADSPKKVMIEYSSPNTNKPIHFGHLRNIFLGHSITEILKANGDEVIKVNLINDRGIHICKSMIAWQLFANNQTPESTNIKGDHFVGDYYVKYNDEYKNQVTVLINDGMSKEEAEKKAPILYAAQQLLLKWEAGDADTVALWKKMNDWVYSGFDVTYQKLGITFDKFYYESNTYLLGKSAVLNALQKNIFYQKPDTSVWIDLTNEGLDQKLLLRADGTSVYMTQDIGTAKLKYEDYQMDSSVYVIGDEQNYHMQVLKLILQKMNEPCAAGIQHLSYGMVELPSGKMKSREGNVVDADDMVAEMTSIAKKNTEALGKVDGFAQSELLQLYDTLGLGALKFYLLRIEPKKKMIFNPEESIDFHGFTGPFIQYTHARICSILRKSNNTDFNLTANLDITSHEKKILKLLEQYEKIIADAAHEMNPSIICNYLHNLAKLFNSFLVEHSVLKPANTDIMNMRLQLSTLCKNVIAHGLQLLGINAPIKM